jgi:two-component system sensor histidine kinase BaeS
VIEALADGLVEDRETAERYLRTAQRDVGVLSRLIDDLFVLAQLDSGGIQFDLETNSLSDLVSDTLSSFSVRAERQGVRLEAESDARPDALVFDALYIGRALSNLVDNALAHTQEGGAVRLETQSVREGVRVSVSDSGPGVAAADVPHLFDRFYRGEASRSRATGGSGLGLAIVKSVAAAHGGDAGVSSSDEGATFYFTLPLVQSRRPFDTRRYGA